MASDFALFYKSLSQTLKVFIYTNKINLYRIARNSHLLILILIWYIKLLLTGRLVMIILVDKGSKLSVP